MCCRGVGGAYDDILTGQTAICSQWTGPEDGPVLLLLVLVLPLLEVGGVGRHYEVEVGVR